MKTKLTITLLAATFFSGCSTEAPLELPDEPVVVEAASAVEYEQVPGADTPVWEEAMRDQVQIPGRLDPTGTYYRPPHKTIVEVRPGRYQPIEYPNQD